MPDISNIQIPPPANWQDFERLCADLWAAIWDDPNTQLNGRAGQSQAGVDIWGHPKGSRQISAVQCKGKEGALGAYVTPEELDAEVEKAKSFSPKIDHFIIATSAKNDARVQLHARDITARNKSAGFFTVDVFGWDEISRRIAGHPNIFAKHYPQFCLAVTDKVAIDVSCLIEPVPIDLRRTVREPSFQGFTYRTFRAEGFVEIRPDVPYRDAIAKGGPVSGLGYGIAPLIGQYPNLDIKIVNDTGSTVFLNEAVLRVKASAEMDEVLPLFAEPAYAMRLYLKNEGWGELCNVWFEYSLGPIDSISAWDKPFPYRIEIGDVTSDAVIDLIDGFSRLGIDVEFLRRDWKSFGGDTVVFLDGTEMARHDYDERSKQAMGMFFGKMYEGPFPLSALGTARVAGRLHYSEKSRPCDHQSCLVETWVQLNPIRPGAPAPSSFQYDATLQSSGADYEISVPISQSIKGGDVDRFCIRTGCARSSLHEFIVELRAVGVEKFASRPLRLEMFVPRRFPEIIAAEERFKEALSKRTMSSAPTPFQTK